MEVNTALLLALFAGQLGGYKVTVFDDGDDGLDGQGEGGLPSEELGSEGTEGSIDHSTEVECEPHCTPGNMSGAAIS